MTSVASLALAPIILPTASSAAVPPVVVSSKIFSKQVTIKSLPSAVMAHVLTFLSDPQALRSMRLASKEWAHLPFHGHLLDLSGYKNLSDDQLKTFLEQLKGTKIQSINLKRCSKLTNKGLDHLSNLTSLISLDLNSCKNITDNGLKHLSKLTSLTLLNLEGYNKITNQGLEHLSKFTCLTSLNLSWCEITDQGLENLTTLPSLTSLNLSQSQITDKGLEHLSKLTSLTSLNLRGSFNITAQGLEHLLKLTCLTSLDLSTCEITNQKLEHLSKLISLTSLNLNSNKITDRGLEHLSQLTSLTSLNLRSCAHISINAIEALEAGLMTFMHTTPTLNPTTDYHVYQLADAPKEEDKWGEQHRYDDLERLKLAQAITLFKMTQSADPRHSSIDPLLNLINQSTFSKETIHPLLHNLPEEIRALIYYQLYALLTQRQDQDHLGKNHCFDDQSIFKSAIIAVLKEMVLSTYHPKPRTHLQIVK